jgi:hypothetical protein
LNGRLAIRTLDHGGEYPDMKPQGDPVNRPLGHSCLYVPITQSGKVVDTEAKVFEDDDED